MWPNSNGSSMQPETTITGLDVRSVREGFDERLNCTGVISWRGSACGMRPLSTTG